MAVIVVKPDRVKKLRNLYPWLYADELSDIRGDPAPGSLVELQDQHGAFLGRAFFSPSSHIVARVLTRDASARIDRAFFEARLARAASRRAGLILNTNGLRLVHAEADELPGLVVDRLDDTLVVQFRNAGVDAFRKEITQALKKVFSSSGAYERSDTQARAEEGLELRTGLLYGEVPERVVVREDAVEFLASPASGQKTGFYLDQRDNRRLLASLVSSSSRVLDVYSYTGGFSLHAARAGAQALAVDKDRDALALLEQNAAHNRLADRIGARWGDAPTVLDELVAEQRAFTHIVLDPPTLARHKNDLPPTRQLFTRLAGSALRLLAPGGILFLSTCAYHVSVADLVQVTRIAAGETARRLQVLAVTYQPADHPWILQIPESLYLKTIVLKVDAAAGD